MDAPRLLFEALKANGLAQLQAWIREGRQEDLYLEFKTAKSPLESDDKKNLAAGVSGFANSEGGLLVWGVSAGKDQEGVDAAQGLRPIHGLRRFASNLTELVTRLVVPAVPGVEQHIILDPEAGKDAGYAVTYVPKAEGLPHMAMAQGQQRYHYRAGDSFMIMEHFMLADRFGRRPQPRLELSYRWEHHGDKTYLVLGITNTGRGIALYPALHVEERASEGVQVFPLDERFGIPGDPRGFGLLERARTTLRPSTAWRMYAGGPGDAIHPGTTLEVVKALGWVMPRDPHANVDWKDISFRYSLHCDGFSLTEATMTIVATEVAKAVLS